MNRLSVRRRIRILEDRINNGISDLENLLECVKINDSISKDHKKDLEFQIEMTLARMRNIQDNLKAVGRLIMEDDDEEKTCQL